MNDETREIMREKAKFFMNQNIAVHISKKNNFFHNGIIKEISSDFLIIVDEVEGELPVFYQEIFEIQKREAKE